MIFCQFENAKIGILDFCKKITKYVLQQVHETFLNFFLAKSHYLFFLEKPILIGYHEEGKQCTQKMTK